jgi:hypothetical protein
MLVTGGETYTCPNRSVDTTPIFRSFDKATIVPTDLKIGGHVGRLAESILH